MNSLALSIDASYRFAEHLRLIAFQSLYVFLWHEQGTILEFFDEGLFIRLVLIFKQSTLPFLGV